MKHKLNVNGDIESRRRIAERRNVPVRETVQHQAAAAEETVSPAAEAPKARRRKTAGDA